MMLKVVLACVVLMAGAYAQDGRVEPAPVPVPWSQLQCCLGGLRLWAWKGIYQLVNIHQGTPRPCCHQITLTWRQSQCGYDCQCTVNETLCCGSCRERKSQNQIVDPNADNHWKEHECCRDLNGVTYIGHYCGRTYYSFRQEDKCGTACVSSCSWNYADVCAVGKK